MSHEKGIEAVDLVQVAEHLAASANRIRLLQSGVGYVTVSAPEALALADLVEKATDKDTTIDGVPTSEGEERETLRSILHDFAVAVDAGVGYDEAIDAYITRLLVWQARSSREGGKR